MWIDHGRAVTSTTHIENLVDATELALTGGRAGEAYFILDGGERSMKAMLSGLAASVGVVLPDRSIPYWLADTIAAVRKPLDGCSVSRAIYPSFLTAPAPPGCTNLQS